jgi:hypothetical protein
MGPMLQKPRLKPYLTAFPISETIWGLRGGSEELWRINLSDQRAVCAFGVLLSHLDGRSSLAEIVQKATEQGADPEALHALLHSLEESSFLEEAENSDSEPQASRYRDQMTFFSRFSSTGGTLHQSQLSRSKVALVGAGGLSACVARHLTASGFGEIVVLVDEPVLTGDVAISSEFTADSGKTKMSILPLHRESIYPEISSATKPQLVIVPQDTHQPALLESMDSFSKKNHIPWLLLRALDPHEGWVGPLFIPGETASYASLEGRLRSNMRFYDEYLAYDRHLRNGGAPAPPCGGLNVFFELLSAIAVAEVIKYVTGFTMPLVAGRFLTIDLMNWETEVHDVLRLPHIEAASIDQPRVFSWKDIPYDERKTRRG